MAVFALVAACSPARLPSNDQSSEAKDAAIASQHAATGTARSGAGGSWKQPWQVSDYCQAVRRGGSFWVWLSFREATADDLGRSYEIRLQGDTSMNVPVGYPRDAQIALDWRTYPTSEGDDVKVVVIREVGTGDVVFRVDDPQHVFREAMFKAGIVTFNYMGDQTIFSMGASDKLHEDLRTCFKWLKS
jgi:hypothetical protein